MTECVWWKTDIRHGNYKLKNKKISGYKKLNNIYESIITIKFNLDFTDLAGHLVLFRSKV